jgi:ribosome biogenesis GTPase A
MLQKVKELIKDLPFENAKSSLDKLEEKLESKNLNVVLVGEFNAGKSSLINRYYGILYQ